MKKLINYTEIWIIEGAYNVLVADIRYSLKKDINVATFDIHARSLSPLRKISCNISTS